MNKVKKAYKQARFEYKLSLITSFLAVLCAVLMFVFVLLPVYGALNDPNGPEILDKAESLQNVLMSVMLVLVTVSVVAGIIGAVRDVRSKSKK